MVTGTSELRCPNCHAASPGGARYCGACGTALAAPSPGSHGAGGLAEAVGDAERRLLTVAFCDLVDSTVMSSRLDPEDWREVVKAYQAVCAQVVEGLGGHVAQYLGDGVLAYFGWPIAQERAAERAVRSGLRIIEAVARLNPSLERDVGVQIAVRLGLHTGIAVTGEIGHGATRERLALGEVPNLAARVQSLAEPGTIVISEATYRLVSGYFECADLGPKELKGVPEPVRVHRVLQEGTTRSRLDLVSPGELTPLVGREPQLAMLVECWRQAHDWQGQSLLLSGEAGIGKSRLARALAEHVALDPGAQLLPMVCSPYYQNSAFHSVLELLERVILRFSPDDGPERRREKLEQYLEQSGAPEEFGPPLLALLSLPLDGRELTLGSAAERQKQRTMDALIHLLTHQASERPTLLLVDDLQWADPSTLDLLGLIVERTRMSRLLVLLTSRPGRRPAWADSARVLELTLERLHPNRAERMLESLTDGIPLPHEVAEQILAKTDGVPLFVEELTKLVLESGLLQRTNGHYELIRPLPELAIPATLHESLLARLDRLGSLKVVAQVGSTIGREFNYGLLRALGVLDEAQLDEGLERLVGAGLLFQHGSASDATYTFKHALIQDTAYSSLLRRTRRQFHQRIAEVLVDQFAEVCAAQPELLAHHYTAAGAIEEALPQWLSAGQRALERSATVEAIAHLSRGLELLQQQPVTPEQMQLELAYQVGLGTALMATRGYGDMAVGATWNRARELCRELGDPPQVGPVLFGLWSFYTTRAEHRTAEEIARNLDEVAESTRDADLQVEAPLALGWSCFLKGEFAEARMHLERVLERYDPLRHSVHAVVYGTEPRVSALACLAETLWVLGHVDQAVRRSEESVALGFQAGHQHSTAHALSIAGYLHAYRDLPDAILECEEAAMRICQEHGLSFFNTMATILRDWALLAKQPPDLAQAVAELEQDVAVYERSGAGLSRPLWRHFLAVGCSYLGQIDAALEHVATGLAIVEASGERFWEAELYRLRGDLLLMQGASPEASYDKALDIARGQGALSLELRATMRLARAWQQQGRSSEAYTRLEAVVRRFPEGSDSPALLDARALLAELLAKPLTRLEGMPNG